MNTAGYQGLLAVIAELLSDDSYPVPAVKRALDLALRLTSTFLVNPSDLLPTDTDTNTREFAIRYLLPLMRAARQGVASGGASYPVRVTKVLTVNVGSCV